MNVSIKNLRNLIISALCLGLCMVLPFLTGQIPEIGDALAPMHIPVLLCGFICGPYYAAIVGFISPALRFLLFGRPPLFPTGIAMCFELAVYGIVSGFLYRALPKKAVFVYISLIGAMFSGRVVWGIVRTILSGVSGSPFTWKLFMTGALFTAIPGIILHIALIPAIIIALQKTKVLKSAP